MARQDSAAIEIARAASSHTPFLVVQIIFDSSSPSITSVEGITNLPGTEIQGVLMDVSSLSQQAWPEEGRTTIGALTFRVMDNASPTNFTEELRDQLLNSNEGVRNREVRVFMGFSSDFNSFQKVATSFVHNVSFNDGVYTVECRDKTAALREDVFEPRTARLAAALGTTDTIISTDRNLTANGWAAFTTTASFTDGPSAQHVWFRVKKTGEIIRAQAISGNVFTGCVRGRFNTAPQAVEYDQDRPAEIEEFIYLEGSAIAVANWIMTGGGFLPEHWHLGIDSGDLVGWGDVGEDLYDPSDPTRGLQVRFTHLEKSDGKKFIEKEIFRLAGVYAPTTVDGNIGLRRVSRVLDSGYLRKITDSHIVRVNGMKHDQTAMRNSFTINWNYDGEALTRSLVLLDQDSVDRHGPSRELSMSFRGLHTAKHTEAVIINQVATLRDRYAEPPIRLSIRVPYQFNDLDLGDVVRVESVHLEDYADNVVTMARNFEVQRTQVNWLTGAVDLELFASVRSIASPTFNIDGSPALSDAWYTSAGTNITGLPGYSSGTLTGYNFTGSTTDINDTSSIWYHDGDLVLDNCFVTNQAQLRVKGALTIEGTLDGANRGLNGVAENQTRGATSDGWQEPGAAGYLGPTVGGSGCWYFVSSGDFDYTTNIRGGVQPGKHAAAPFLTLDTDTAGNMTSRFPKDLRGSSGGTGGQCINANQATATPGTGGLLWAEGGDGGDSGAGLAIICRGLFFNIGGSIDLSGEDGTLGQGTAGFYGSLDFLNLRLERFFDYFVHSGSGAGGMPGALHVILDGDLRPFPDINSVTFKAEQGASPVVPNSWPEAAEVRDINASFIAYPIHLWDVAAGSVGESQNPQGHVTGINTDVVQSRRNIWRSAHRVQYMPKAETPVEDVVPAPQTLNATGGVGKIDLTWVWPGGDIQFIEVFVSESNDRAFAEEVAEVAGTAFAVPVPAGGTRWIWIRARGVDDRLSDWFPKSATNGVEATATDAGVAVNITTTQAVTWNGDGNSPVSWVPSNPTNVVTANVVSGGQLVATEQIEATLNTSTGNITWSVTSDHPLITASSVPAQSTPSPSVTITFFHDPSLISNQITLQAINAGVGAPGPPGLPGNKTIGLRINTSTFAGAPGSDNGEMYLHGFDPNTGNAADVDGEINYAGDVLAVPKGVIRTSQKNTEGGWIVFDTSLTDPFTVGGVSTSVAAARKITESGSFKWEYDNDTAWVEFITDEPYVIIGTYDAGTTDLITTAGIWSIAVDLSAVAPQNPHFVKPGDVQPGALGSVNLSEFAAGVRPIRLWAGGSLPTLPDSDYPAGTFLWWSVTPFSIYRVSAAGSAWEADLDGADLVAGSVTAAKLQAVMTLTNILQSGSGTNKRVEIEGAATFPFWIGSGAKGTVTGSPGAGAKVWYDEPADEVVISGRLVSGTLETSIVAPDADFAWHVDTDEGYPALISMYEAGGFAEGTAITDTNTFMFAWAAVGHPGTPAATWDYRRLSQEGQTFKVIAVLSGSSTITDTITYELKYAYDSGAWTSFSPAITTSNGASAAAGFGRSLQYYLYPKPTGWTTSVQIALFAKRGFSTGTVKFDRSDWQVLQTYNVGNTNITGTEIS